VLAWWKYDKRPDFGNRTRINADGADFHGSEKPTRESHGDQSRLKELPKNIANLRRSAKSAFISVLFLNSAEQSQKAFFLFTAGEHHFGTRFAPEKNGSHPCFARYNYHVMSRLAEYLR
jgi:hypothetical protein